MNNFNVKQFDQTVTAFYEGNNTTRQKAQATLTEFQRDPDSWKLVDQILEHSLNLQAKFIALGILEDFIKVRWNTLPMDQRLVMRNYLVKTIIGFSSDQATLHSQKMFLNKLDFVLVQILKKDWPQYWPSFIGEIVNSSQSNSSLCENNMKILRFLSEEVFDFSIDYMTVEKMQKLKNQMVNEFESVLQLCKEVLFASDSSARLVIATLEALQKFIGWIPIQFVYQRDLIQILESKLASGSTVQRNLALQCFYEMINLQVTDGQYDGFIVQIYTIVTNNMTQMLPGDIDNLPRLYSSLNSEKQYSVESLAVFWTSFLVKYRVLIENQPGGRNGVHTVLVYLLKTSEIPELEIWKICLEYWEKLIYDIVQISKHNQPIPYQDIINRLCITMIDNMVKPDDVFLLEDEEDGEISRDFIKQSDTTALSKTMRHVFSLLTTLDCNYIQFVIHEKILGLQLTNISAWSWDRLFHLCWAIGSMSGGMSEQQENQFLESIVTENLLGLLQREMQNGQNTGNRDYEWVAASCLFYIAVQYPRFLQTHWDYLTFILQQSMAYMQINNLPDVQEMACDSFLKICQRCKECLSLAHQTANNKDNTFSVLDTLLTDLSTITAHLNSHQLYIVYEAIAEIISASQPLDSQKMQINVLLTAPNGTISKTLQNGSVHNKASSLKEIIHVLRIYTVVCKPTGPAFRTQLASSIPYLVQCYQIASQAISTSSSSNDQLFKRIRQLVLKLLEEFILSNEKLEIQDQNMMSDLIQVVLIDYQGSKPDRREPLVLSLLTNIFEKTQGPVWPELLKQTIEAVFVSTLPMITSNFVDYPEFRHEFYRLLRVLNRRCFIDLFQFSDLFKIVIDSIMWGTKHNIREISQIALQTCLDMINIAAQIDDEEDTSSRFFETYYVHILRDILEVLVDPDCRNGFNYQSQILSRLLELVQEGEIYTRVFNPSQVSNSLMSNAEFLQQYVLDLLCNAFPLLQKNQIEMLVRGMFEYSGNLEKFQNDIRDFLADIREVDDALVGEQRVQKELDAELELLRSL